MEKRILEQCLKDRDYIYKDGKSSFKKYNIDLIIKMFFLLFNSYGRKTIRDKTIRLFIDEVKNSNMHNNLMITHQKLNERYDDLFVLEFYKIDRRNHIQIGMINVLKEIMTLMVRIFCAIVSSGISAERIEKNVLLALIKSFKSYLNEIYINDIRFIQMSDHHFYSTICAMLYEDNTYVMQHGLIMEKDLYYPILAGHFCAWGKHSKSLLENDFKVMITGTYKFTNIYRVERKSKLTSVLFCISSLDEKNVERKIVTILEILQKNQIELKVKCHPGSLFSLEYWKKLFKETNIAFYKEERLQDIEFDLAISENSTINIDLMMMGKPFIIFDSEIGYFGRYFNIIPNGNDKETIEKCLNSIKKYDFGSIFNMILQEEINNGKCSLMNVL